MPRVQPAARPLEPYSQWIGQLSAAVAVCVLSVDTLRVGVETRILHAYQESRSIYILEDSFKEYGTLLGMRFISQPVVMYDMRPLRVWS